MAASLGRKACSCARLSRLQAERRLLVPPPIAAMASTSGIGVMCQVQQIWSLPGASCCLDLGSHVGPQGCALNLAVSFGRFRCHVGKVEVVLCLSLMI